MAKMGGTISARNVEDGVSFLLTLQRVRSQTGPVATGEHAECEKSQPMAKGAATAGSHLRARAVAADRSEVRGTLGVRRERG
jgi:hypothetical protein